MELVYLYHCRTSHYSFLFYFFFLFFLLVIMNRGIEMKKKRQKKRSANNILSYTLKSVYIHRTIPYIRFSSSLIPHPSLSVCLSFHLLLSSFLLFLSFYLLNKFLKKDIHTASHSAYKTASESVPPEFLSQPISLAFPPNGAQR